MILANGLIRTLDPQVPTQRALAIAGEHVAGGVGVHETALASPEVTRPRRARRRPRLHRLARALPDVGARAERGEPRRVRDARRGARADRTASTCSPVVGFAATAGAAATGSRSAIRPRQDLDAITGDTPAGADRQGLPLALAQLGGARARGRRSRGRGRRRRARCERRADRDPARGGRLAFQGAAHDRLRRRLPRRDARRRARSRTRAGSPPSTTRTAGSERCVCGSSSRNEAS